MAGGKKLTLWEYSAVGGSLAVAVSSFLSLLVPGQWQMLVWIVAAIGSSIVAGLLADRFVSTEDERP